MQTISHYVDSRLTQDLARQALDAAGMVVGWYTNKHNTVSVVHNHPYFELIIPLQGEVLYSSVGSLYHVHRGDLILFPDEVFHMGKYDLSDSASERLLLQIERKLFYQTAANLKIDGLFKEKRPYVFPASLVKCWDLRRLFLSINKTADLDAADRSKMNQCLLSQLLLILSTGLKKSDTIPADSSSRLASSAEKYIQRHYHDANFTLAQLCEALYVSRSHLSRVFRSYTLSTISEYVTSLRLQHFKYAVAEGKSILEAAQESGFSDYTSFLKTFRKTHGQTPSQYKKSLLIPPEQAQIREMPTGSL